MQLLSFKIKNFRSIIDTGWTNLSLDNVTALVGQNESGKTAILEALSKTFSSEEVEPDDLRHGEPPPDIWLATGHSAKEILAAAEFISNDICKHQIVKTLAKDGLRIEWHFHTAKDVVDPENISTSYSVVNPNLRSILNECNFEEDATTASKASPSIGTSAAELAQQGIVALAQIVKKAAIEETLTQFSDALFEMAPTIVLFKESSGLLPNIVDVGDDFKLVPGVGTVAARNFLTIARINLKDLVESDTRSRESLQNLANR